MTAIDLVFNGKASFILIIACLWVALFLVLFELFSSAIQLALQNFYGFQFVSHILDDFIFLGPASSDICARQCHLFLGYAALLGIPIKHSKTVVPSPCVTVHGIEIETCVLQARLPPDKLDTFQA